jgi:hypothetical protein
MLAIVALSVGLGQPASAQRLADGADLFEQCRHQPSDAETSQQAAVSLSHCYGFMKGVGDAHAVAQAGIGTAPSVCPPEGSLSGAQSQLIFLEWAHDNPEGLDKPAVVAVTEALSEAFPCSE